jgi:RHS repeat-associated protein
MELLAPDVTPTADGLTSELTLGSSGASITTDYAANDEPSSITVTKSSTLQEFAYADAPDGSIVAETDTPSSSLSPADYTYDDQGRVTSDTPGTGSENSYGEDQSDNLTTLPTGASGTYDDASELTSSTLSDITTDYTYDASGNRTAESSGTTMSATYNGAGELTSYDNSAANLSSATYNGLGLRTSETSTPSGGSASTQNFVWDTNASVPVVLEDSTYAYIYGPSGTPFEQVTMSSGTVKYLDADALGSVRGVVSSSGSLSSSTSYGAWGVPETTGGLTTSTPFGFAGGYTDGTGLLYLINRYYDPMTGNFVSVDPEVNETGQPYSYAEDDPVTLKDPSGNDTLGICAGAGFEVGPINAGGGACLTRTIDSSGEDDIGLTGTIYAGAGDGVDSSTSYYYQISTATNLHQLSGPFFYATIGGEVGGGASMTIFWNLNESVIGIELGYSEGLGADIASGSSDTWVGQINNKVFANIARGVWDGLNPGFDVGTILSDAAILVKSELAKCN